MGFMFGRKQGLYLSDLEKPGKITKTLTVPNLSSRSSQCIVQWNPHASNHSYVVSSVRLFATLLAY